MNRDDLQAHLAHEAERDAIAEQRLTVMFDAGDVAPLNYPCETGDVVAVVAKLGYRASPDYVFDLLANGIPPVGKSRGKHRWLPTDVLHLIMVLESRRRWMLHPLHLHKLSALEQLQLEAEAEGANAFHDLDQFCPEQLVLLMEGAETFAVRHAIRVALMAKLREGGLL